MKLLTPGTILIAIFLYYGFSWLQVEPRVDWKLSSQLSFEPCKNKDAAPIIVFGATSMLGRYLVDTMKSDHDICLITLARSNCKKCDVSIKGDIRDIRLINRVLDFYKPNTVITAVKPPLLGVHYKTYIEVNLLSMIQLVDASIEHKVSNFIYVSSIAAAGHYFDHYHADETAPKPFYTDFEAPYDVSKRFTEDYLLSKQSKDFNTIALRVGGIIGGSGDPYSHLRFPFLISFNPAPPGVDVNYAGNVAQAVSVLYNRLYKVSSGSCTFCGDFYYYTGVPMTENDKARIVANVTGKPVIHIPRTLLSLSAKLFHWARFEVNIYSWIDLMRMGLVPQTFDQSKFHAMFPEFKAKMTLAQALEKLYGVSANVEERSKEL